MTNTNKTPSHLALGIEISGVDKVLLQWEWVSDISLLERIVLVEGRICHRSCTVSTTKHARSNRCNMRRHR